MAWTTGARLDGPNVLDGETRRESDFESEFMVPKFMRSAFHGKMKLSVQEIPWGSGGKQQRRRNTWMEIAPPVAQDAPLPTFPKQVGAKKWLQVPVSRFAAVEWVSLLRLSLVSCSATARIVGDANDNATGKLIGSRVTGCDGLPSFRHFCHLSCFVLFCCETVKACFESCEKALCEYAC